MKVLNKIHLINWHYIPKASLNISRHLNFFTGKTGAGKSTVLDAIQLLMLGDTRGDFFNKAASGASKRDLIEYLRGMNKENEREGKGYLRNGDFTSYIVIEFKEKDKLFCLGVIFDVFSKTNSYEHIFFHLGEQLPNDKFIENDIPLSIDQFKKRYKGKVEIFTSNKEYRERFLYQYMGKLRPEFYDAFKKSVPFTPPKTIREFYEKFICETIEISIEDMRENVRLYRQFGVKLENIKEQVLLLQSIKESFEDWKGLCDEKEKVDFILEKTEVEQLSLDIATIQTDIEESKARLENSNLKLIEAMRHKDDLEARRDELRDKIRDSEENQLYTRLKEEIDTLQEKIDHINKLQERFRAKGFEFSKWLDCLKDFSEMFNLSKEQSRLLEVNIKALGDSTFCGDDFTEVNHILARLKNKINKKYYGLQDSKTKLEAEISTLKSEIEGLKKGKTYPKWLVEVKDTLKAKLGSSAVINIFADTIEVRDASWTNAIEGFINSQKLNLIVSPEHYDEAVLVFEAMDGKDYDKVGIVNIKPLMEQNPVVKQNSLAEEIITADIYSQAYTNYLLGDVQKCESVSELKNYRTAVTKNCHSYKSYVLRKLNPWSYTGNAYIGVMAQQKQIALKEQIIEEKTLQLHAFGLEYALTSKYINLRVYDDMEIEAMWEEQLEVDHKTRYQKQYQEKYDEWSKIDLTYCNKLQKHLKNVEEEISSIKLYIDNLNQQISNHKYQIKMNNELVPDKMNEHDVKAASFKERYCESWIEQIGQPFYIESIKKLKDYTQIKQRFSSRLENMKENIDEAFDLLITNRQKAERKGIAGFDLLAKTNEKYDEMLESLSEIALPKIQAKIQEQEAKAYHQLKEDLLYKLHDGIEKTIEQIKFLNKTLEKMDFGKDRYQLKVEGSRKYPEIYKMLRDELLYQPNTLMANSFEETHKDAINMLFEYISDNGSQEELDLNKIEEIKKNIAKFTDYRTYLEFDMVVTTGGEPSDLSKIMSKNSGGETQMPFYISVLASFIQLYRMDKSEHENTLRLIMFDEAFSKMDEEHIRKSIELIKSMKFQAIIVAPDDKIRSIGPMAEKIFYVQNEHKKKITISPFEKDEIEDLFV